MARRRITKALTTAIIVTALFSPPASGRPAEQVGRAALATSQGSAAILYTSKHGSKIDRTWPFTPPGEQALVGDFVGDSSAEGSLEDIFWYTPGQGGDAIWRSNGDRSWQKSGISITASYQPLVGQFSKDHKKDIFWYAPGGAPDFLWDFNDDGTISTIRLDVSGTYRPIVGRFSHDDTDDIIWYARGKAADSWWDFHQGTAPIKRPLAIDGRYTPIVGKFAGNTNPNSTYGYLDQATDIIWYAPGPTGDWLWDFNGDGGKIQSSPLTINGTYTPLAFANGSGFAEVLWYAPGTAQDASWAFTNASGAHHTDYPTIDGNYAPLIAPVNPSTGTQDIVWFGAGARPDAYWDESTGTRPPITLTGDVTPVIGSFEFAANDGGTIRGVDILDRHR